MVFKDTADLSMYYEENRKELIDGFLQKYQDSLNKKNLFTVATSQLGQEYLLEHFREKNIEFNCDCQLRRIAYLLIWSIQDLV